MANCIYYFETSNRAILQTSSLSIRELKLASCPIKRSNLPYELERLDFPVSIHIRTATYFAVLLYIKCGRAELLPASQRQIDIIGELT